MRTYLCVMAVFFIYAEAKADPAINVKLNLNRSTLTEKQNKDLSLQILYFAAFENTFKFCGIDLKLERRTENALRECVTDETIERLRAEYRAEKKAQALKQDFSNVSCDSEEHKKWRSSTSKIIDNVIATFARRCRQCFFCRL